MLLTLQMIYLQGNHPAWGDYYIFYQYLFAVASPKQEALIALASGTIRLVFILIHHVTASGHGELSLLQYTSQLRISWIDKINRP
jgi:hypothetical protein